MVFTGRDHSHWWANREDYGFGWLVPVFVVFVVKERWTEILAAVASCGWSGSPWAAGWQKWVLNTLLVGAMLGGALMFLLGAFYRAGVPKGDIA